MTISTLSELMTETSLMVEELISTCDEVSPDKLGLDRRAGWDLRVSEEFIACPAGSACRNLEYYGGFEYVDRENVWSAGGWVFYTANDSRVEDCIASYYDEKERADADGQPDEAQEWESLDPDC